MNSELMRCWALQAEPVLDPAAVSIGARWLITFARLVPDEPDSVLQCAATYLLYATNPDDMPDDLNLVEVVAHHLNSSDPRVADHVAWHRWAVSAAGRLCGPAHPTTLLCGENLTTALRLAGRAAEALPLQSSLIDAHREAGNHTDLRYARIDYAHLLHDAGSCRPAADEIDDVWQQWLAEPGRDRMDGSYIFSIYLIILVGCRRNADVENLLHQVPAELGTAHLVLLNDDGSVCPDAFDEVTDEGDADTHTGVCAWAEAAHTMGPVLP